MLYVRYQDYAAEIERKDQLINENIRSLNSINRDHQQKTLRLATLQKELGTSQSQFTAFEFRNKQLQLEAEMQLDHYESEVEGLAMQVAARERDMEYKQLEYEHAAAELLQSEQSLKQGRSFLVTQGEKIQRLKENIQSQQIKKMLSQS
jgi:hypothetical protein